MEKLVNDLEWISSIVACRCRLDDGMAILEQMYKLKLITYEVYTEQLRVLRFLNINK